MKVLIVEDEALIALSWAQVVESLGHRVLGICASLPAARELTRREAPDVALVDLRLGGGRCGAKVDEYLNEAFGTTSLYVTANRDFAYRYGTRAIGFAEKPLSGDSQFAVVRFLTAWHEGRRPPVPPGVTLFGDAQEVMTEAARAEEVQ
ncbi:response regulator [Azospirillum sp. TSO22-1]|uniref:response regulator n=1 Tax=Azospirillum sp. TSO22-1 TaxID=716789 RepID=UPI001304EF6E|nr:response regulator [Azospirillum sp. TSO22-1]